MCIGSWCTCSIQDTLKVTFPLNFNLIASVSHSLNNYMAVSLEKLEMKPTCVLAQYARNTVMKYIIFIMFFIHLYLFAGNGKNVFVNCPGWLTDQVRGQRKSFVSVKLFKSGGLAPHFSLHTLFFFLAIIWFLSHTVILLNEISRYALQYTWAATTRYCCSCLQGIA